MVCKIIFSYYYIEKYFNPLLGLYERFLYWIISKKNFVQQVHILQDDLPSLEYLFITRMQIGFRIYEYDEDALAYLQPILCAMRSNNISSQISTEIPLNKRAGYYLIHISPIIVLLCFRSMPTTWC